VLAEKTGRTETDQGEDFATCDDEQQKYILVQVALRLFHEQGFSKTSLPHIAKGAGMSLKTAQSYFSTTEEICYLVIDCHLENQSRQFDRINENGNPRMRLSLFLDDLVKNADLITRCGCPLTNLYFDVKREDSVLSDHVAKILQNQLKWINEQFVSIMRVEGVTDLPERLISAIHGISVMAEATGNDKLISNQVNQLKSWIRSM